MKSNGYFRLLLTVLSYLLGTVIAFSIGQWQEIKPAETSGIRITDKDNYKWDGLGFSYRVVVPVPEDHEVNQYSKKGYRVVFRMRLKYHEVNDGWQYAFFEVQQKSGKTTIKYSNKLAHGGDKLLENSKTYYLGNNLKKGVDPLSDAQEYQEKGIETNFPVDGLYTNIIMMFGAAGNFSDTWIIDDLAIQYMIIKPESPPITNGYYQISTLEHLHYVSCFASGYINIEILNNIDAAQTKAWYEGTGFPVAQKYTRVNIKGNNHTISGLTIDQPTMDTVGLFRKVDDLTVNDLRITSATIRGRNNVGVLSGVITNSSMINNCSMNMSVTGQDCVGGIIGRANNSTIKSTSVTASIQGNNNVGGITANTNSLSVQNVTFDGDVTGVNNVGGISGYINTANIDQTSVNVQINAESYTGGLIGSNYRRSDNDRTYISDCIIRGTVNGRTSYSGGIAGYLFNGMVTDISADISVSGKDFVGGLIGSLNGIYAMFGSSFMSELHRSYNQKDVIATGDEIGGLIGNCYYTKVVDCLSHINVKGNDKVGGIIGAVTAAKGWGNSVLPCTVTNSYSLGVITGNTLNKGGIIGWGNEKILSNGNYYVQYKLNDSYYLMQDNMNEIGTAFPLSEFNNMEHFKNWDLAKVWIFEIINDFYPAVKLPYLHNQFKEKLSAVFFSAIDERGVSLNKSYISLHESDMNLVYEKYKPAQVNLYPGTYSYSVSAPFPFKKTETKQFTIANPKERLNISEKLSTYSAMPNLNSEGVYEIATIGNLLWLSLGYFDDNETKQKERLSATYKLVSDIDATDTENWNPDKSGKYQGFPPISQFKGTLDGNGYTISNLFIQQSENNQSGLFKTISENAEVKDLAIMNARISGSSCGILAYENNGNINNVFVSGTVGATNSMGGLVAQNYGSICSGAAVVTLGAPGDTVSSYAGGLVAINNGAKIDKSYAYAQINAKAKSTPNNIGGLAGYASENSILRSYYLEGTGYNTYGTALTPAQFGDSVNFIDWDFQVIWKIGRCEQINQTNLPYFFYLIDDNIKEITFECKNINNEVLPGAQISVFSKKVITNSQGRAYMKLPVGNYSANVVAPVFKRSSANAFGLNENKILELILDSIQYQSGTGTLESPFLIAEMEHLRRLFENRQDWDKHFRLSNNINAEETKDWEQRKFNMTIGDTRTPFSGEINGCMYEISNLNLITPIDTLGMFGVVKDASISNLKLTNNKIQGKGYVAGLASVVSNSEINNIHIETGEIIGESNVSGLINVCSNSLLDSISLNSKVRSTTSYGSTAGLIGISSNDVIQRVHSKGSVSGYYFSNNYVAGLIAEVKPGTTIMNSYSTANVSSGKTGGLVGLLYGKLTNVYFSGSVNPESDKAEGGLCAAIGNTAVIDKAYSTVKNTRNAAISSSVHSSASLTDVYWDKDNSGQSDFTQINQTSGLTSEEFSSFDKWPTGDKETSVWCLGKDKDDYIRPLLSWSSIPVLYQNIEKVKDNSSNPLYYTGNSDVWLKSPVAADGYYYDGFYEDAYYTTSISRIPAGLKEAVNVWIKCTPISYNIHYYLNGGVNHAENPVDYTIEDQFSILPPSKEGYEFGGWFNDPLFQFPADLVIQNQSGHLQYHALWEIATSDIKNESLQIKVYPNPATSVLYIKCSQGSVIELFNSSGTKIYQTASKDNIEKVDISSYLRGLYFLKINDKSFKLIFQ